MYLILSCLCLHNVQHHEEFTNLGYSFSFLTFATAPEYYPTSLHEDVAARFSDLASPLDSKESSYSSTDDYDDNDSDDEEEEEEDDHHYQRRRNDKYSLMKEENDDNELSSIPLPPPSSPYEVASAEGMQG